MATFKMGQRVRIVGGQRLSGEAVITGLPGSYPYQPEAYSIAIAGIDEYFACPEFLVPLTDPKADAFIESIKKMKPYSEPTVKREVLSSFNVAEKE